MARVILFGATGRLGRQVLAAGHEVKVLVRDPSRLGGRG
jgi:uncharacterized protein YbjT (DUF2867 family)